MARRVIELMDDMHLSSQSTFLDYYNNMEANNLSGAISILKNNPDIANQIITADNINILIDNVNRRELIPKIDIDYFLEGLLSVFQKMIDNTKVVGEWNKDTQYDVHNFVYYNSKEYYAYTNTQPPIGTLPTDTKYWLEYNMRGSKGYGGFSNLNYLGNWDSTINYNPYDVVIYQNKMWMAIAQNINYAPNLNHYPWSLIMLPDTANKTPIQKEKPSSDYNIGDFWFKITQGDDIVQIAWETGTPEPTPRLAAASFMIGNNIYVVGGQNRTLTATNTNEAYDVVTNTWSSKADYPVLADGIFGFEINGIGYCAGGLSISLQPTVNAYSYNPNTNVWTKIADLPEPLASVNSTTSFGGYGYCVGGISGTGKAADTVYRFSPSTSTWEVITNMPLPRYSPAVESLNGKIYVIGGSDVLGNIYGDVQIYDIGTNTWGTGKSMLNPRGFSGSFTHGDDIYVLGGLDKIQYATNLNEVYNTATNTWKNDIPMTYTRTSLCGEANNSKGYAIGGINIARVEMNGYVEEYSFVQDETSFEMLIDTTLGSKTVSIPMIQDGNYNYWIDWGDGFNSTQITTYNDTNATHTYAADGEYTIRLTGTLDRLLFTGDIAKDLKEVTKSTLTYSSIESMFKNCANLTSIPDRIFSKSLNITSASNTFYGCTNLKIIPIGLFDNNSKITSFNRAFSHSGLTSIPTGLFDGCREAKDFEEVFSYTNIVSIPRGLFDNNSNAERFNNAFSLCRKLENVPNGLFSNCPTVNTYAYCFQACSVLKEIPGDLFGNALVSAKTMDGFFEDCWGLLSVPAGLFQYGSSVTTYSAVLNRTNIVNIPDNFFNGTNAITSYLIDKTRIISIGNNSLKGLEITSGFFQNSTKLKKVGENALSESHIEDMNNIFNGCTALTDLGNWDLTNVTTASGDCFKGCTNLTNLSGFKDVETLTKPTIKNDFSLVDCSKLTHESLMNVVDSLAVNTPDAIKTLTLNTASLNLLSTAEKLEIINKYWNIAGYNPTSDLNEEVAKDLVQLTKGNDDLQAVNYLTTNLYYYVQLINNIRAKEISGLYAVDKSTGIMYDYNDIPTTEYVLYGAPTNGTGKYYFITKNQIGDPDGTNFKNNIDKFLNANPTYTTLRIGDNENSDIRIKGSGFETLTNANALLKGKSTITSISVYGKFTPTVLTSMFENCSNLSNVSFENINASQATDCSNMFSGCSKLQTMLNFNMSGIKNVQGMYQNSGITEILPNVFSNTIENASNLFLNCTSLTKLPADYTTVFGKNSALTNVSGLFQGCSSLKNVGIHNVFDIDTSSGIPEYIINSKKLGNQLFRYCPNITNMSNLLKGCTLVGSDSNNYDIPMGLFYYCPKVTNISHIFDGCKNITTGKSLPGLSIEVNKVLFAKNTELVDVSYAFANSKTDLITENTNSEEYLLFPVQTKIKTANNLWENCEMTDATGIEAIPFIYKSKVLKNIEGMFKGQTFARQLPAMNASSTSEFDWGRLNEICPALENCSQMFYGNTKLTETASGSVLTLINTLSKITTLNNHTQAFTNCTQLTNYNNIPADWK